MPIRTPPVAVCWVSALTALASPKSATLTPAVVADQHVLGLDVAVDQAGAVGRARAPTAPARCSASARPGAIGASLRITSRSVWPGDQLHGEEDGAVVVALVEDADDVGVGEPGRGPGLADEARREVVVVAEPGMHHLDRDRAVEPDVGGLVDTGHAAAGDPRPDPVAPVEQPTDEGVAAAGVLARAGALIGLHVDPPAYRMGKDPGFHRTDAAADRPRLPAFRRGVGSTVHHPRRTSRRGDRVVPCPARTTLRTDADLGGLVTEWLDWPAAAAILGVTPAKVRTMIRDHELAAAVPAPGTGPQVPAEFLQDGLVVKGLPGLLTVLHDAGFDDRECIAWLFTDADLPGRPIDALRENRGSEVKRRAQAMGY